MQPRDLSSLLDMIHAARLVLTFLHGVSKEAFDGDVMRQAAVIRELEVIGESVRRLSDEFRQAHPKVPWSQIIGMRNLLIHAYDHVDLDEVWNAAQLSIPELLTQVEAMLPSGEA